MVGEGSALPDKMELALLGFHVLPLVNLRWLLGTPILPEALPEALHGAPCGRCGVHLFSGQEAADL